MPGWRPPCTIGGGAATAPALPSILPRVPLDLGQVSRDVLDGLLLTGRDGALDLRPVPLGHVARHVDGRAADLEGVALAGAHQPLQRPVGHDLGVGRKVHELGAFLADDGGTGGRVRCAPCEHMAREQSPERHPGGRKWSVAPLGMSGAAF